MRSDDTDSMGTDRKTTAYRRPPVAVHLRKRTFGIRQRVSRGSDAVGSLGWRIVGILISFAATAFALPAQAAPTAIQVCKLVENNQDSANDGGVFEFGLNYSGGSFGAVQISAYETGVSSGERCASPVNVPAGATAINVPEVVPAGWNNSAAGPARPSWKFTGTGLPAAGIGGNTQTAALAGSDLANASGTVKLVFTNRQARTLTVCKRVEDNNQAPAAQGGTFTFDITQTENSSATVSISATEGQTNCHITPYQLNSQATLASFIERPFTTPALGYPKYELRDSSNALVGSGTFANAGQVSANYRIDSLPVNVGTGNLTLTVVNRYVTTRKLRVCKAVEGSNAFNGGYFQLFFGDAPVGAVDYSHLSASNVGLTVNNNTVQCTEKTISANASPLIWESGLPPNWTGNATGYPKWELYVDDGQATRNGTPLSAGRNEDSSGALGNKATGTFLRLDAAAAGTQDVKVVIVNKMDAYGNGSAADTGALFRLCKEVENNGDAKVDAGGWNVAIRSLGALGLAGGQTGTLSEGQRQCTGSITAASLKIVGQAALFETFAPTGWPGDAPGYPKVVVRSSAGDSGAYGEGGTGGDLGAMQFSSSPVWFMGNPQDASFRGKVDALGLAKGDYSINVVNKAYPARTITICSRVDENGLAPAGQVTPMGTEGGAAVCAAPVQIPFGLTPTYQTDYTTFDATSFRNGMMPRYGYLEFNDGPGGTCNGRISATQISATEAGTGFIFSANTRQRTITPSALTAVDSAGREAFFLAAGTKPCKGNVTATWVMTPAPEVRVCKQVLQNGDAVNDGGIFALNSQQQPFSGSFGAANPLFTDNLPATEGGGDVCGSPIPLAFGSLTSANTFNSNETLPSGYDNLTPSYPRWQVRAAGVADPLNHPRGGVIASNNASLVLTPFALPDGGTPEGLAQYKTWGNLTFTALNRRGADRFMRICTEVLDNNDGLVQNAATSFTGNLNGQALGLTAPAVMNAPEGTLANLRTGVQCTAQIDITELNPLALAATIAQALGADFVNAGAFPVWHVYDSNNLDRTAAAVTGTGSTASFDLSAVKTPNFDVVFTNQYRAPVPLLTKALAPAGIVTGGNSTLTFTVTNNAAGAAAQTGIGFTDTLPSHIRVAAVPAIGHTCSDATISAAVGADNVIVTGLSIAANSSCTVSINVTSAIAQTQPEQGACTSNVSPPAGWTNGNASISSLVNVVNNVTDQCLVVRPPSGTITVTKNITGVAASAVTDSMTFPFTLTCSTPAATYHGTVTVAAGSLSGDSAPVVIPAGSTACTITEGVLPTALKGYEWSAPNYTQPDTVALAVDAVLRGAISNPLKATGVAPVPVPINSPWMLLFLVSALAALGYRQRR